MIGGVDPVGVADIWREAVGVFLNNLDGIISRDGVADYQFYLVAHILSNDALYRFFQKATIVVVGNDY